MVGLLTCTKENNRRIYAEAINKEPRGIKLCPSYVYFVSVPVALDLLRIREKLNKSTVNPNTRLHQRQERIGSAGKILLNLMREPPGCPVKDHPLKSEHDPNNYDYSMVLFFVPADVTCSDTR